MPINSLSTSHQTTPCFTYVEARSDSGTKEFVYDNNSRSAYQLLNTSNTSDSPLILRAITKNEIKHLNILSIDKLIHFNSDALLKNPSLTNTILGQFRSSNSIPNRFRAIDGLGRNEITNYKQLSSAEQTMALRCELTSLIDDDLKNGFKSILEEWVKFGISACEVDRNAYAEFKSFYDCIMKQHAVVKEDYSKVDFTAQNIKSKIADPRCLNAKLTPFQIFKAAFQLGDVPGVTNFRFMDNPATKDDGKYREWMFHFDNSNYAAEFKLITTRQTDTVEANQEQCLAAFPYDTTQFIRFTATEAATKFPTLDALEKEISDVQDARYVVMKNQHNNAPIETGIRTEMVAHHRSGSNKEGLDHGECRSAELMTFHGMDRCHPFLSTQELEEAVTLTRLQKFVLGGFRDSTPDEFMVHMKNEKQALNLQLRTLLSARGIIPLERLTVAKFTNTGTVVLDVALFNKQMSTYEALPDVIDQIPRLIQGGDEPRKRVLQIVPMLMNFDQNAELKPDCSENKAFPARTQIRERTNEDFRGPLHRDLEAIHFNMHPSCLLGMDEIIGIAKNIRELYQSHSTLLKQRPHDIKLLHLFESRAALANEYTNQLSLRATLPETHQTITLFIYYMIDDLDNAAQSLLANNIILNTQQLKTLKNQQCRILQHFITIRMFNDSLPS